MDDEDATTHGPGDPAVAQEPLRVIVVDDHDLFRAGLRRLLEGEADLDVVADASSGQEAVKRAAELRPDVVVMDINMPGMSGIEATRALLELSPASAVLMLTISESEDDVLAAVLAGASGYLLKDATLPQITSAIRATHAGESIIAPRVAGGLLTRLRRHALREREKPIVAELSGREIEVLRLLVAGADNADIGIALDVTSSTVKSHVSRVLDKLGVENRIQAAVLAVQLGLVEEDGKGPA
jgi:DNA-binding NarL/FixJ family response regulator